MSIPSYSPALDGIMSVGIAPQSGAVWVPVVGADPDGNIVRVDPQGNVSTVPASSTGPYVQFCISADGQKASCMPARADGQPQAGARWFHYGLIVVPTSGF